MQFAAAAPVADPIGGVAEAGHLDGKDTRAEGVHRSWLYEDEVSLAHGNVPPVEVAYGVVG